MPESIPTRVWATGAIPFALGAKAFMGMDSGLHFGLFTDPNGHDGRKGKLKPTPAEFRCVRRRNGPIWAILRQTWFREYFAASAEVPPKPNPSEMLGARADRKS